MNKAELVAELKRLANKEADKARREAQRPTISLTMDAVSFMRGSALAYMNAARIVAEQLDEHDGGEKK